MRINEILLEDQTDEGLGQAIGKAWGGAMKGIGATAGGLAGSWDAMKQGYQQGKSVVSGKTTINGRQYVWDGSKWVDDQTGQPAPDQSVPPPTNQQAPATGGNAPAAGGAAASNNTPTASSASTTPSSPAAGSAAAAAAPSGMKAAEIVKDLDDVWSKVTADQGSQTSSPQVQQKIIAMAKAAGLSGQTIKENKVGFHSRFLEMEI